MLGSRLSAIAYPLLVLTLTGSPVVAGWAGCAVTAPSILVYLPAGALVDRWDPRTAMLVSEVGRGAAIATVVVALAFGDPSVPQLVAVAISEGILEVFSALSERRFVCSLAEPEKVASTLARSEARTHMAILIGRPLGGLLFGLGRALPFFADAISFAVSVGTLLRIGNRGRTRPEKAANRRLGREVCEGLRWLASDRYSRVALPLTAGATIIGQGLIMVFLAEAHAHHMPPVAVGVALAASGGGGALGAAAASWLIPRIGYSLLHIQMWIWTCTFMVLALLGDPSFSWVAIVMAILGFTGALGNIEFDTYLVRKTPEKMLARVISVGRLASFGALAVGPPLGGIFAERYGLRHATFLLFIAAAFLAVVAAATSLASRWVGARSFALLVARRCRLRP